MNPQTKLLLAVSNILRGAYPSLDELHEAVLALDHPPRVLVPIGESGEAEG